MRENQLNNFRFKKCIIIDDDDSQRDVLNLFAKNFAEAVFCFNNAEKAEKFILINKDVDLIITDYFIPNRENGVKVAKFAKQNLKNNPFCILISGDMDAIKNDNDLLFVDEFLEKPIDYKSLLSSTHLSYGGLNE